FRPRNSGCPARGMTGSRRTLINSACIIVLFGFAIAAESAKTNMSWVDAKPVLQALRRDLLPSELRDKTPSELEPVWPVWVQRHDASIRARVDDGDEDSLVNFML